MVPAFNVAPIAQGAKISAPGAVDLVGRHRLRAPLCLGLRHPRRVGVGHHQRRVLLVQPVGEVPAHVPQPLQRHRAARQPVRAQPVPRRDPHRPEDAPRGDGRGVAAGIGPAVQPRHIDVSRAITAMSAGLMPMSSAVQ